MRKRRRSFKVSKKVGGGTSDANSDVKVVKYQEDVIQEKSPESNLKTKDVEKKSIEVDEVKTDPPVKDEPKEEKYVEKRVKIKKPLIKNKDGDERKLDEAEAQIDEIDRIIKTASVQLEEITHENEEIELTKEEPEEYDGISNTNEHIQLLEAELKNSHKQAARMAHEIELLKAEFVSEKKELETSVKKLRKELHRTAPIQDNKFFSLSKDLREAVESLEEISDGTPNVKVDLSTVEADAEKSDMDFPKMKVVKKEPDTNVDVTVKETIDDGGTKAEIKVEKEVKTEPVADKKVEEREDDKKEDKVEEKSSKKSKSKKSKKKKMMITGGAAVAVLVLISGLISSQLFGETAVDDALVKEYLENEGGDVAGVQTTNEQDSGASANESDSDDGANEDVVVTQKGKEQADASQTNVSFDESIWDSFSDNTLGVKLQYPINAVKLNKTESNATFQRKNGYIFKVQRIETGLDLDEYWKQIQATSLMHKATPTLLDENEALFLELEETTEFPGDKYLVKTEDAIIEVWYATPSQKFDNDDMLRVERMLKTLSFGSN